MEEMMQDNNTEDEISSKIKSKDSGKKFLIGIICGMLISMCILGIAFIGKQVYRSYRIDKAIKAGSYGESGEGFDSKLMDEKLASKIVTLESVIDKYYLNDYTTEDLESIRKASSGLPIFRSSNMSLGVHVLRLLASQAARMLKDFDIEIINCMESIRVNFIYIS